MCCYKISYSNKFKYDSNEILNNNNNMNKYKYRLIDSVNNHIIQKYFMIKNGLSVFIDYTNNDEKNIFKSKYVTKYNV